MAHDIKFDNEKIITPIQWDESYEKVQTVNTTEAGTDQVIVIRENKLTVTCSFQCTNRWYHKFMEYNLQRSVTVNSYDPHADAYTDRTMRIEGFNASFQQYSDKTENCWVVSFTLIEF